MNLRKALITFFIVFLLLCLGYAYIFFSDTTIGAGSSEKSPNGEYLATALGYTKYSKFGGDSYWLSLAIENQKGEPVWHATITSDDRSWDWRRFGKIIWQEDSNKAIFVYKKGQDVILRYMSKEIIAEEKKRDIKSIEK